MFTRSVYKIVNSFLVNLDVTEGCLPFFEICGAQIFEIVLVCGSDYDYTIVILNFGGQVFVGPGSCGSTLSDYSVRSYHCFKLSHVWQCVLSFI